MVTCDVAVVGAGITGCAIARELARYRLDIVVVEAGSDVATGTTKANGGIVHSGYDPEPGTVKAQVNAPGNRLYDQWSQELDFEFRRTGSLVLGFTEDDRRGLEHLLANGVANGVRDLEIVDGKRLRTLEPRVTHEATAALWCSHTGVVDPYAVAIATAENAAANGARFLFDAPVTGIADAGGAFEIATPRETIRARWLVNAAGCYADDISHMAGGENFQIIWRQGNLLVFDRACGLGDLMPVYPVPTPTSKGVVVFGTVHGNLLVGSTAHERKRGDLATYAPDIDELVEGARRLIPDIAGAKMIRQFAGGRPVIAATNDFLIGASVTRRGLFQAAGIQSPGVASAPAVAERVVGAMRGVGVPLEPKPGFDPRRRAPEDFDRLPFERQDQLIAGDPAWGRIVCRCETVPEAEIVEAIRREPGARSVEGVKRRCRAGMGRCQGGFCQSRVIDILARELGLRPEDVPLENAGSNVLLGRIKEGEA